MRGRVRSESLPLILCHTHTLTHTPTHTPSIPDPHPCLHPVLSDNNILGEGELAAKSLQTNKGPGAGKQDPAVNNPPVVDAAHEQARGRGRPLVQDIMRYGGYRLHEKLDKGKRVYLVLRRNMEDHNKAGFESF